MAEATTVVNTTTGHGGNNNRTVFGEYECDVMLASLQRELQIIRVSGCMYLIANERLHQYFL